MVRNVNAHPGGTYIIGAAHPIVRAPRPVRQIWMRAGATRAHVVRAHIPIVRTQRTVRHVWMGAATALANIVGTLIPIIRARGAVSHRGMTAGAVAVTLIDRALITVVRTWRAGGLMVGLTDAALTGVGIVTVGVAGIAAGTTLVDRLR